MWVGAASDEVKSRNRKGKEYSKIPTMYSFLPYSIRSQNSTEFPKSKVAFSSWNLSRILRIERVNIKLLYRNHCVSL